MDLCDTNIWLALVLSKHHLHRTARTWLDTVEEPASLIFCRSTQQSLLRLLTNAAVLGAYGNPPLSNAQAWSIYAALLEDDRVSFRVDEPAELEEIWKNFASSQTASPKLWTDAYLAAFASAAGYRFVSADSGFRQFPGLRTLLLTP